MTVSTEGEGMTEDYAMSVRAFECARCDGTYRGAKIGGPHLASDRRDIVSVRRVHTRRLCKCQ
jgi:hypothetical protein